MRKKRLKERLTRRRPECSDKPYRVNLKSIKIAMGWMDLKKKWNMCRGKEVLSITEADVKETLKNVPNWKSRGLDEVSGFWTKDFNSLHT